jgi:hypothetical protein
MLRFLCVVALLLGSPPTVPSAAAASDSIDMADHAPFMLSIDYERDVTPGGEVALSVMLDSCPEAVCGFDLMIAYNADYLQMQSVLPGSSLFADGCGWEEFRYGSQIDDQRVGEYPNGRIRLRARAESDSTDGRHPRCFRPDSLPAMLATLRFLVTDSVDLSSRTIPVVFYWLSDRDNLLYDSASGQALSCQAVFDFSGELLEGDGSYPSMAGPATVEDTSSHRVTARRRIECHNGGIGVAGPADNR